jgi:homoserine O-succinyltransferase
MCYRQAERNTGWDNDFQRTAPDLLIVTGAEPSTNELANEPFWQPMVSLLDWAAENGTPALLSCLATHAAVLHFDGIRRIALPQKRFGVFRHDIVRPAYAAANRRPLLSVPHSRWNELPETELVDAGYAILTRSDEAGVDMFVRPQAGQFLFCQGHPEYEPETLLREYRRDVARYLRNERATYPDLPVGYFDAASRYAAALFRQRAEPARDAEFASVFPYHCLLSGIDRTWYLSGADIVATWLLHACASRVGGAA